MHSPSQSNPSCSALSAWLELLRVPNLFTVPGDVVVGYCLVGLASAPAWPGRLVVLIGASLSIYAGGLLLNDWFDLDCDRRERPERPLPSGRIGSRTALSIGVLLLASGPGLALLADLNSFLTALVLAALVVLYDGRAKQSPWLGPVTMGLCRAANVLLGASVAFGAAGGLLWTAVLVVGGYVALLTAAAAHETQGQLSGPRRFAPVVFLALGLGAFLLQVEPVTLTLTAALVALAYPAFALLRLSAGTDRDVPRYIGRLIRALIPLQAAFVLGIAPTLWSVAAFVLLLLPLSLLAARRFAGS